MPAEPAPAEPAPELPPERGDVGSRPERSDAAAELARRRRLAELFGEVLPEDTADDRLDRGHGGGALDERWYLENRPPHHDG